MNPTQSIEIFDMPRIVRCVPSSFLSEGPDPSLADGNIVSEVGEPVVHVTAANTTPMLCYELRLGRKPALPAHVFGKMKLGSAFSAFLARVVPLPPVGTRVTLQPRLTPEQATLIDLYHYVAADFYWIIHIPSPIGVGTYIEIFAPEIDSTTKTRGIRIKPAGANTVQCYLPWSSDLKVVPTESGRTAQSGGAICIRTIEDNTVETMNSPLNMTIYQCTTNIRCSGFKYNSLEFTSREGLNFIPQAPPPPQADVVQGFEFHSDNEGKASTEVNAEGNADIPDQIAPLATPANDIAPEPEKPTGKATAPKLGKPIRTTRNQTGLSNTRWYESQTLTFGLENLLTWVNLTINPSNRTETGENISRAYRRNVWVTGANRIGYVTTTRVKSNISRAPQVSGLVEFCDSRNNSSRYLCELGGNIEFDVTPFHFANTIAESRPRYYNSSYLRTDEASNQFRYRVVGYNRNADTSDTKLSMMVKPGNVMFDVPLKPRSQVSGFGFLVTALQQISLAKDAVGTVVENFQYHNDDEGDNHFDNEAFITPYAGEGGMVGEADIGHAFNEDLDQDDFAVELWNGSLPPGEQVVVPINLAVAEDLSGGGGDSTIAEKFTRNAHICTNKMGTFGPNIGSYVIELRLPTGVSGNIAHVSLPGDMTDEAVLFAFGLSDILGIATSALQAVGGPTLSAAIGAGRAIFNIVKNIGGSNNKDSDSDSVNQPSLSGGLDISRFINFLKPIVQNEAADPTMPNILLQARDFLGSTGLPLVSNIPARIWGMMNNSHVERSLFDRLITPTSSGMKNQVIIPHDRWAYIVDVFGQHKETFRKGSKQYINFVKFMSLISHKGVRSEVKFLTLEEVLSYEYTTQDEIAVTTMVTSKRFITEPQG